MYIAIKDNVVKARATTLEGIYTSLLHVRITKEGTVYVNGKLHRMSYNMNEYTGFTVPEAYKNFMWEYARKELGTDIEIFKQV